MSLTPLIPYNCVFPSRWVEAFCYTNNDLVLSSVKSMVTNPDFLFLTTLTIRRFLPNSDFQEIPPNFLSWFVLNYNFLDSTRIRSKMSSTRYFLCLHFFCVFISFDDNWDEKIQVRDEKFWITESGASIPDDWKTESHDFYSPFTPKSPQRISRRNSSMIPRRISSPIPQRIPESPIPQRISRDPMPPLTYSPPLNARVLNHSLSLKRYYPE